MTTARTRDSLGPMAVLLAVVAGILFMYGRLAHAAPDPASTSTPALTAAGLPWQLWIVAVLAALAGFETVLKGLSMIGHAISPRTKTLVDDKVTAGIDELHDKVDVLRDDLAEIAKVVVPPTSNTISLDTARRNPQAGMVGGNMMAGLGTLAVVALIIGMAGGYFTGCAPGSTARQAAAAGVVAALDCELLHIDGDVMADARLFADAKVQGWISGVKPGDTAALQDRIAADLKPIKSDLGHCAIAGALAAATVVVVEHPGTVVSALAVGDPVQLRAAFAVAARQAGWAPVKIAGGAVL